MEFLDHVVIAQSVDDFSRIHEPNINLIILPRDENNAVKKFFEEIHKRFANQNTSSYFYECFPDDIFKPRLDHHFQDVRNLEGCEEAVNDLTCLADSFRKISRRNQRYHQMYIDLALLGEVNDTPAFHTDKVELRLICTYLGRGTEWVSNDNVNRESLTNGEDINSRIRDQSKIYQIKPFWVALMKGELYVGNRGREIIHRSPNLGDKDLSRVRYRITSTPSNYK